uniref:Inter-alpha-trypsin inhibitor heavy chain H3 n=1 Tax=Sinocyclocheilus grahami TaxID=75366 RepID=A0A672MDA7_SINGR
RKQNVRPCFLTAIHIFVFAMVFIRIKETRELVLDSSYLLPELGSNRLHIEVQSTRMDCKVASRFAHTVMTTKALNTANASQEVFFEVDLPKTAFITNFSMLTEGRIYVSEVKEKEQARQQYESAVSSGQTAGLVKASGRKMEKFSVSVNIAPQSSVTFTLTYEELLQRRLGSYEIMLGVRPKQLVQTFEIVVDIYEPKGIAFVDVNGTFITNELLPLVKKTVTDKKAHVYFSPTLEQQKSCSDCEDTLIDGDLLIRYDVNHPQDIGEIQIINGYFVHFFAPDDLPQMPKNMVFVIDRSGSMEGEKMKQTREALMTILSELHEDDYFGLVTFDDTIESWRPFLSKATPENVTEAKEFVRTIKARHSKYEMTDINKGLLYAVDMLTSEKSDYFPDLSMIILLTDGRPNSGVYWLCRIKKTVLKYFVFEFNFEHNPPSFAFSSMDLRVIKDLSLTVTLRNSVRFLIILHKIWQKHPYHQDYLGFYTLDSHHLSNNVHGLLGQFYHGVNFEVSDLFPGKDPDKQDANMFVKGNKLTVTRGWKRDFRQDVKNGENVPCWFIHNNGTGLLDGVHTDYIISGLFKTI